ncbi:YjjW family glycine radical enzyme activase [Hydrogenoanaerobacterium sp.]|uniref:YjjW family glycine radical enzyme activase n=1 Tax=Hydrogenoanaerobacterium sp. TaxID=2953763 RepID=UPI00289C43EE|nr:YjjW family glycine radical enzyme activase [Hydrogenoanaerobacterium sp.]
MLTAIVNKILPTSVVDGPGNRVSIFLQGCNIHCAYCHNPETQRLCVHCGACVPGCPAQALAIENRKVVWNEDKCIDCDACIKICPNFSSPKVKEMTPQQVYQKVLESVPFIRGITVSGGECMLYPEFLAELFRMVKAEGLTCLIDSNGMVDLSAYPELVALCDGVMLDIKSWDNEVYRTLVGFDNLPVKKNLVYLSRNDKIEELRIVCLPGEVDAEAALQGIAQTIGPEKTKTTRIKLIKFRPFGVKGRLAEMTAPENSYMQMLEAKAAELGFEHVMVV